MGSHGAPLAVWWAERGLTARSRGQRQQWGQIGGGGRRRRCREADMEAAAARLGAADCQWLTPPLHGGQGAEKQEVEMKGGGRGATWTGRPPPPIHKLLGVDNTTYTTSIAWL